jgi:peroxiredoxin
VTKQTVATEYERTEVTTIAAQVRAMHTKSAAEPSSQVTDAFTRERAALAETALPDGILPLGSAVPDADLLDAHGASTSLYAATHGRRSVVVFYRGAWCPYCNLALRHYQEHLLPALEEQGVALVAISPQTPDGSLTMQQKHGLGFAVLSDPGSTLAGHLGILTAPSIEARAAQLRFGLDLTDVNADGTVALPMPTTVVLDDDQVLRWIDVHPDYSTRSEVDDILAALGRLGREAGGNPS